MSLRILRETVLFLYLVPIVLPLLSDVYFLLIFKKAFMHLSITTCFTCHCIVIDLYENAYFLGILNTSQPNIFSCRDNERHDGHEALYITITCNNSKFRMRTERLSVINLCIYNVLRTFDCTIHLIQSFITRFF